MEFNLNDEVMVKLTDHGRAVLASDHDQFWALSKLKPDYMPKKEDENGWSKWQLWTLMEAFGKHIRMGGEMCFETTIKLVID